MNRHLILVAAAALAAGGIGFNGSTWAQETAGQKAEKAAEKTGQAIGNAAEKTGDVLEKGAQKVGDALKPGDAQAAANKDTAKSAEEIHDVLAQVAEASLTKKGLDDMVERFVDADRNRLGQGDVLKQDHPDLDGRIAQFQQDWKGKYNQDFDIKDEDAVYNLSFARISESEEGARTAGARVGAEVNTKAGDVGVTAENKTGIDAPKANTDGNTPADRNLNDPGRNIATVHIAASHGMPALDVPMIHEAGGWKLDIPDTVDAKKFKDNVQTALTELDEKKDQWSADANDAYRHVTHRLLLAIFDKQLDQTQPGATGATGAATP